MSIIYFVMKKAKEGKQSKWSVEINKLVWEQPADNTFLSCSLSLCFLYTMDPNTQDENSYDYVFKIVIVGDSGVGKTNLLGRFVHDTFDLSSKSTIGLDLNIKNMKVKDKLVRVQLWDTAGQERYRSITKR